jgi:hypothetical protein
VTRHTQALVQVGLEVVDDVDATELGEDLHEDGKHDSLPVGSSLEHLGPSNTVNCLLESDLIAHLVVLGHEEAVVLANVAVQPLDDNQGLIVTVVFQQPSGRVGEEVDADEDSEGRETLESKREAPLEFTRGVRATIANPLDFISGMILQKKGTGYVGNTHISSGKTEADKLSMQACNHAASLGRSNLRVVDGDSDVHHADGEASDDSTSDEHANVHRGGLDNARNHSNAGGNGNGLLTTEIVGAPSREEDTEDGSGAEGADQGALEAGGEGMEIGREMLLRNDRGDDT